MKSWKQILNKIKTREAAKEQCCEAFAEWWNSEYRGNQHSMYLAKKAWVTAWFRRLTITRPEDK